VSVVWFHRHLAPVAYRGAVVVSGEMVLVTLERALFLVGGQLRRSRSAQLVRVMRVALISSRRFICAFFVTFGKVQRVFFISNCADDGCLCCRVNKVYCLSHFLCLSVSVNGYLPTSNSACR
jgi:hypothetical protein